jgi:hypothetical protein
MICLRLKISFVLLFFLLLFNRSNCQNNLGKEWVVSYYNNKLIFEKDTVIPQLINIKDSSFNFVSGNSNICDSSGSLLLFATPFKVFNGKTGKVIEGGNAINNDSITYYEKGLSAYSNTSIILPKGNNQYYIFISTQSDAKCSRFWQWLGDDYDHDQILYSIVDMNANNGAGKVIVNRRVLLQVNEAPWLNKTNFTATRHANGRDWWLVKPSSFDRFIRYKFLVSNDTIMPFVETLPHITNLYPITSIGQSCFSHDGTLYAENNENCPHTIWHFDRCSGQFTIKRIIDLQHFNNDSLVANPIFNGICFSPNNRYLYAVDDYWVYQIDLNEPNDTLAVQCVSEYDTSKNYSDNGCMQLTPTGQIYIGHWGGLSQDVNAIMNPNEHGKNCNFKFNYCIVNTHPNKLGGTIDPPNIPFYGLGALAGSPCDTIRPQATAWLLYPNPASNIIKLKVPNSSSGNIVAIKVYNMLGQQIINTNTSINFEHEASLPLNYLASGVYVLKAQFGKEEFVGRFLVR